VVASVLAGHRLDQQELLGWKPKYLGFSSDPAGFTRGHEDLLGVGCV